VVSYKNNFLLKGTKMSNPNIVISGRIGTDIDARVMPDGTQKAKFRIITSDRRQAQNGEWEDYNTSGWTIVAWDKMAVRAIDHLSIGMPVTVQGHIKEVSWVDHDGNKKKSTETRAIDISININHFKKQVDSFEEKGVSVW
jgi:single-strand DNA-binding protein